MFSSQRHQLKNLLLTSFAVSLINICKGSPLSDEGRIYHGEEVKAGDWPFMVALFIKNSNTYKFFCGGSIISDDTILTATHCAWPDRERSKKNLPALPSDIFIYVGNIHIGSLNESYLYVAKEYIINDKLASTRKEVYDPDTKTSNFHLDFANGHDVAIIKTEKKIKFEEGIVSPVCLPGPNVRPIGEKCIVMGWGDKDDHSKDPKMLFQVEIPIMTECRDTSLYDTEQLICAGNIKYQKDACQGDSGGPFVCPLEDSPKEYLQFGIVSFGEGCGEHGGFYQNTTTALDWIKEHSEK